MNQGPAPEIAAARSLRATGLSQRAVARRFGLSQWWSFYWTGEARVGDAGGGLNRWPAARVERLLRAADEGYDYADLADRFGLKDRHTVKVTVCKYRRRRAVSEAAHA